MLMSEFALFTQSVNSLQAVSRCSRDTTMFTFLVVTTDMTTFSLGFDDLLKTTLARLFYTVRPMAPDSTAVPRRAAANGSSDCPFWLFADRTLSPAHELLASGGKVRSGDSIRCIWLGT